MTEATKLPCPACGTLLVPDDEGRTGPAWPQHRPDGVHSCRASFRPLAIAPPAAYPDGAVCSWPSPRMRIVLALARMHYARPGCEVGGELHIVLDDDNVEAEHVEWCRDGCEAIGDAFGVALANRLLALTEGERGWVAHHVYGSEYPDLGPSASIGQRRWVPERVTCPHAAPVVADHLALAGLAP